MVRARDRHGLYDLPFPVRFRRGSWFNARTGGRLDVPIVVWRHARKDTFPQPKPEIDIYW